MNRLRVMRSLIVACSLALSVGCASSSSDDDTGGDDFKVGLVTDVGRVNDGTFNQYAYEGGVRAANELGVTFDYAESQTSGDYEGHISSFAEDGYDLIVTLGFNMGPPTVAAARDFPDQKFATVDWADFDSTDGPPANFRGLLFAEDEAGYLAGVLAGGMTAAKNVGVMAGIPFPPLLKFANGYAQGVRSVCADCTVQIIYVETFSEPSVGALMAAELIANGADVVFAAAGAAGGGAIKHAAANSVWAIGVDQDEFVTTFAGGDEPGAQYLLSSALKKVGTAVYETISSAKDGNFSNETAEFSVANNGIGLADYHAAKNSISDDVDASVTAAEVGLGDGSVATGVKSDTGHMEDRANRVEAVCRDGEGTAMDCCLDDGGYPQPSWSCG